MKVFVNGEPTQLEPGAGVRAAAAAVGIEPEARGIAVAVDGVVVPRADFDSTVLVDGQRVEIVAAIQGGAR
jgi:sulfur carrier protein